MGKLDCCVKNSITSLFVSYLIYAQKYILKYLIDYLQLSLYVDGQLAETTNENFEILDDWPLHPTDRVHFTKLVVGACWKGNTY
jgi:hypothetical protein